MARLREIRFTVFEISNEALSESYISATPSPISEAFTDMARRLPPRLSRWRPKDVRFKTLGFNLSREDARRFIAEYARQRSVDRKYITEPDELLF